MRMALGARPRDLESLVLRRAAVLVLIGVPLGLGLALGFGRAMSTLLYGLSAVHPASFLTAVLVISGVAAASAWWPARRAGRVSMLRLIS